MMGSNGSHWKWRWKAAELVPIWRRKHSTSNGLKKKNNNKRHRSETNMVFT